MPKGKKHRTHTVTGSLSRELVEIVVSFDQSLSLLEVPQEVAEGRMTFQQYAQPLMAKIRRFKARMKEHNMRLHEAGGDFLAKYAHFLQGVDDGRWTPHQFCEQELELFNLSKRLKQRPEERELLPGPTRRQPTMM